MKKIIFAGLLLGCAQIAPAALIDNGSTVIDSGTGLEWLDLSFTRGLTYNQVDSEFGSGGLFEGYRFATRTEVTTFFTNAGIPDIDAGFAGTAANVSPVGDLMSLWDANLWGLMGNTDQAFGYFFTASVGTGLLWVVPNGATAEATTGPDRISAAGNADFTQPYLGSALVRVSDDTVPAPAPLTLLGTGLISLLWSRRKKA